MTFSYSATLSSSLYRIRFMISDTVDSGHLFEDEEISALFAVIGIETFTAAALADTLGARFSKRSDVRIGQTNVSSGDRAKAFFDLAARLRAGGAGTVPGGDGSGVATTGMAVGGISEAEKQDLETGDSDRVQPSFSVGQDDQPGTSHERAADLIGEG